MKRDILEKLLAWKNSADRKPLILSGARQVGKTYSLIEFGRSDFKRFHYLNFQEDKSLAAIFEGSLSPETIIESIQFVLKRTINFHEDLIIFDEIQDCPRALTSLKYFCEDKPEIALCCAGSLLGVVCSDGSFPVGKVNFLKMFPVSFEEFLSGIGDVQSYEKLRMVPPDQSIPEVVHAHLVKRLKEYMIVGGLPEVVRLYARHQENKYEAFEKVRQRQKELIASYMGDFLKYSGKVRANDIAAIFESIPSQLARENKKFKASDAVPSGRFAKLQSGIDWLVGAGLVIKVKVTNSAELPLSAFTKPNRFKLYLFDIGILGALGQLSANVIYSSVELFSTFKGAFCENYVAQEFVSSGIDSIYAWANNTAEIEFLREKEGLVYPIEVKAGLSGKLKSLNVFAQKYKSPYRIRLSARNLEVNEGAEMHSYPLYLTHRFL